MAKRLPALQTPPSVSDNPALQQWLMNVKTILENVNLTSSQPVTATVTDQQIADLVSKGLKGDPGEPGAPGAPGVGAPTTSVTPVALTGLIGVASRTFVILTWNAIPVQNEAQHTIIYRNTIDDPITASIIGTSKTLVYSDYIQGSGEYFYWIASQSRGSVASPEGITGPKNADPFSVTINPKISSSNSSEFLDGNALDYATYIGGTEKPANNATNNGRSGNLLPNAGFYLGTDPWLEGISAWGENLTGFTLGGGNVKQNTIFLSSSATGSIDFLYLDTPNRMTVTPGQRLEFFCHIATHRCTGRCYIDFWDSSNTLISEESSPPVPSGPFHGGANISGYSKNGAFATVPANAQTARFVIEKSPTDNGQADSYLFAVMPYVGIADANQAEFSEWSEGIGTVSQEGADVTSENPQSPGWLSSPVVWSGNQITAGNAPQFLSVGALGADFIGVVNLAAINANMGTVTAGLLQNADGTFEVNLSSKFIEIAGPGGRNADDYIRIENGDIQQFIWTGATHQQAQRLSTIEVGTAANGQTVTLSKYYPTQPKIIVTAHDTPIYKASNSGQDQTIQIRAENITQTAPGTWQFDAISRLVLGANSESQVINEVTGPSSSDILASSIYTSPSNATDVTVSVDLTSIRSTATQGTNHLRSVTWIVYYRVALSGSAWTPVHAGTSQIGATVNPASDTQLVTFPSAGTWEIHVNAVYQDAGGTFSTGGTQYELDSATVTAPAPGSKVNHTNSTTGIFYQYAEIDLPAYNPPAGWEVYNVDYSGTYNYFIYADSSAATYIQAGHFTSSIAFNFLHRAEGDESSGILNWALQDPLPFSYTTGTYTSKAFMTGQFTSAFNDFGRWEGRLQSASAIISIRRPVGASETPSNTLKINDFNFSLTGATQLQTGTLGWQAIL